MFARNLLYAPTAQVPVSSIVGSCISRPVRMYSSSTCLYDCLKASSTSLVSSSTFLNAGHIRSSAKSDAFVPPAQRPRDDDNKCGCVLDGGRAGGRDGEELRRADKLSSRTVAVPHSAKYVIAIGVDCHSGAILGRVVGRVRALGHLDRPALKLQGLQRSGDRVVGVEDRRHGRGAGCRPSWA